MLVRPNDDSVCALCHFGEPFLEYRWRHLVVLLLLQVSYNFGGSLFFFSYLFFGAFLMSGLASGVKLLQRLGVMEAS
jgi:hypothetical protein